MQKCMSDYLDSVCGSVWGEALRQAARTELSAHLTERFEELTAGGMGSEAAAEETVARMGAPVALGRRITAANRPRHVVLSIIGCIALVVATLIFTVYAYGGHVVFLIDLPALITVILLTSAFALISCGGKPTLKKFLRGFGTGAIYSGVISAVIGAVFMLGNLRDLLDLGPVLSVVLLSPFYGVLFCAAARAAENWVTPPEPGSILKLL